MSLRRLTPPIPLRIKHPVLRRGDADLLLEYADKIGWDPQSYHLADRLDRGVGVEEKLGGVFDPQLFQILHRAGTVCLVETAD